MPIYEYRCDACGHQFEEWQSVHDEPVSVCPQCDAARVEKLMSISSFQLKGGGWYADGYASAKKKGGDKASGSSKSEDKTSSKSDESKATSSSTKSTSGSSETSAKAS